MIDIDYFKMVNDTYGHDVGDEAIKMIAQTLKENIRSSDIAVRYGGEEFMILLYDCEEKYVAQIAEKIRISLLKNKLLKTTFHFQKRLVLGLFFPVHTENFLNALSADIFIVRCRNIRGEIKIGVI